MSCNVVRGFRRGFLIFIFFFLPAAEEPEIIKGLQHYKGTAGKGTASGAEDAAAAW